MAPSASAPPSPAPDPAATYAAIERDVEAIRGLRPTRPITPRLIGETELQAIVAAAFAKDNPDAVVAANERLLKTLGLMPAAASLKDLYLTLLGSQVAGLYSPTDKTLYVVSRSGMLGPVEKVTFAHEFTHALQDQAFNLASFGVDTIGQGDRSLARLSLVEGDATDVMTIWATTHLGQAELLQLAAESSDPTQLAVLAAAPAILREGLLFPYTTGEAFVGGLVARGGFAAVDAAFRSPPDSTEQIIHPDRYASRDLPTKVVLPADLAARLGSGWKVGMEDTLGEFQLGVWLRAPGVDRAAATVAAANWGGDRVALVDGPAGARGVVDLSVWDTAADADAFVTAAEAAISAYGLVGTVSHQPGSRTAALLVGSDEATLTLLDAIFGHTGV